jgi:hypothetical protein
MVRRLCWVVSEAVRMMSKLSFRHTSTIYLTSGMEQEQCVVHNLFFSNMMSADECGFLIRP